MSSRYIVIFCLVFALTICATTNAALANTQAFKHSSRSLLQRQRSPPSPNPPSSANRTEEEPSEDEPEEEEEGEKEASTETEKKPTKVEEDEDDTETKKKPIKVEESEDEDKEKVPELTKEEREAAREEAALAAFAAAQERRANESRRIIQRARIISADIVQEYETNQTTEGRVAIFQRLFQNGAGVVLKFAMNTLVARSPQYARYVIRNARSALYKTVQAGFTENAARAIEYAFTIFENPGDHYNLLDACFSRYQVMEKWEEGSGCSFIQNLFRDADAVAYELECFLDPCTGKAASCCEDRRAVKRGLCGCPNRKSTRCEFNLFAQSPRTVWVCSTRRCGDNAKCLCPPSPTAT